MAEDKLSKNELKRRMKADKKATEKAEKEAAKPAQPEKDGADGKGKANEEEISPNEYFKLRSTAIEELKKDPATHPYPHKFHVDLSLTGFIEKYNDLPDGQTVSEVTVRVAGRIHAIRESGAKLIFYDLRGEGAKIQVSEWHDLMLGHVVIYCVIFTDYGQQQVLRERGFLLYGHGEGASRRHYWHSRPPGQDQEGRAVRHSSDYDPALALPPHAASPPLRPQGQGDAVQAEVPRPHPQRRHGASKIPHPSQNDLLRQEVFGRPGISRGKENIIVRYEVQFMLKVLLPD
jgi:hypothetical protein